MPAGRHRSRPNRQPAAGTRRSTGPTWACATHGECLGLSIVQAIAQAHGAGITLAATRRRPCSRRDLSLTLATATATQAATATQSRNRPSGSMKLRWATLPNDNVATLYMPSGKTTLQSVGS